jgi:glycosyltransferase involved in cell wall biosynthesis
MCAALAERGVDITLLTPSDTMSHPDEKYSFPVIRIPRHIARPQRWARTMREIVQRGWQNDVLFVNGLAMEAALANLAIGKPMVQRVSGDLAWERASDHRWTEDAFEAFQVRRYGPRIEGLRALRTWWTRRATRVIVPSRYLGEWSARWGVPRDRIDVIPNGMEGPIDLPDVKNPIRQRWKVVTVGRMIPLKRIDETIAAVARIAEAGLLVIGDGPERARLERLVVELSATQRVHFAGARNRADTLALVRNSDLLVLNSTHETFPHVVLEAMSLGIPVLATPVGGVPEIIQDHVNGRLVVGKGAPALAGMIDGLLNSGAERRRLSEAGLETARHFNHEAMVALTESALRRAWVDSRR